jgi:hypothetical protein
VVADGEVIGTWRPRTRSDRRTVVMTPWRRPTRHVRALIDGEAERLAAFRGTPLAGVEVARPTVHHLTAEGVSDLATGG